MNNVFDFNKFLDQEVERVAAEIRNTTPGDAVGKYQRLLDELASLRGIRRDSCGVAYTTNGSGVYYSMHTNWCGK